MPQLFLLPNRMKGSFRGKRAGLSGRSSALGGWNLPPFCTPVPGWIHMQNDASAERHAWWEWGWEGGRTGVWLEIQAGGWRVWNSAKNKQSFLPSGPGPEGVVQLLSCVRLFATPWTAAHQASLSFAVSWSLLKLMSNESVMPSNHLILSCPLLLLPSIFLSIRVFSNESAFHLRWPEYWSFSISSSNDCSRLISFKIDWFDLLDVQGTTLKNLLQYHNSKASILQCLAFYRVQLSHMYMTTGKTIALTRWTFVSKVMSLLFSTLSRFATAFLPSSKHLLILWLQERGNQAISSGGKNKPFSCKPTKLHRLLRDWQSVRGNFPDNMGLKNYLEKSRSLRPRNFLW